MKIAKYLHSCLLFEEGDTKILFDPGKFSFAEGMVKPEMFAGVSAIIITHNHPDHFDIDILKRILDVSKAQVICNSELCSILSKEGITVIELNEGDYIFGTFKLKALPVKHEPLLDSEPPAMTAYIINDRILNPADSFQASLTDYKGIDMLLLPIMAPFLTELMAADFGDKIKPKHIIPIHDGYAKEFFLKQRYENYAKHFKKSNIIFHPIMEVGASVTI